MDSNLLELLEVLIFFSSATIVTGLFVWFKHAGRKMIKPPSLTHLEDQMQALQQSLDAIAVEVERISEGQRFTTKLLADRAGGDASALEAPRRMAP